MDLFGARAVPALILAGLPALAAADCSSLDGTYQEQSVRAADGDTHHLSDLTMDRGRSKLFRFENPGSHVGGLAPTAPLQRRKATPLAATATLTYAPKKTLLRFMDSRGAVLAELGIDGLEPYTCRDGRLQRTSEGTSGLGDAVRTERIEETLERNAAGDLVYREARSVVGAPAARPKNSEYRFPAVR